MESDTESQLSSEIDSSEDSDWGSQLSFEAGSSEDSDLDSQPSFAVSSSEDSDVELNSEPVSPKKQPSSEADSSKNQVFPWIELPPELRMKVLQNVTFPILRNFMFLSKECLALSTDVGVEVFAASFHHCYDRDVKACPCVKIELDFYECREMPNFASKFSMIFSKSRTGGCKIETSSYSSILDDYHEDRIRHRNEDYPAVAARTFFQMMKYIRAPRVFLEVYGSSSKLHPLRPVFEQILAEQPVPPLLVCETFTMTTKERAFLMVLPRFLAPGCELRLELYPFLGDDGVLVEPAFFRTELVQRASIIAYGKVGIIDEELLLIQGPTLRMVTPFITGEGINGLIKQWLKGERKITEIILESEEDFYLEDVTSGLDVDVIVPEEELIRLAELNSFKPNPYSSIQLTMGFRNASGDILGLCLDETGPGQCMLVHPYTQAVFFKKRQQ